jgi:hypothetical protein
MNEIYKDIKGYEGIYQISSCGNVKRICFGGQGSDVGSIKTHVGPRGYVTFRLSHMGVSKTLYVHRVVAETFIEGPTCCPTCNVNFEVNHKDGNKSNNNIENLEYVTRSQNVKHASKKQQASCVTDSPLTEDDVRQIRAARVNGARNVDLAKQYKVSPSYICDITKMRQWKHVV